MYTIDENEMMIMIGVQLHLEQNATVERDIMVNLALKESLVDELHLAQNKNGVLEIVSRGVLWNPLSCYRIS